VYINNPKVNVTTFIILSITPYGAPFCFCKHFHQLTLKPVYIYNPKVNVLVQT
jgi:hypothetical protein